MPPVSCSEVRILPACRGKDGEVHKDAPEWYRKQNKGGKGRGKGKGKARESRKEGTAREDRCARTEARAMAIAATAPTASSPTTVLKAAAETLKAAAEKENGMRAQRLCQQRQSSVQRKKS